MKEPSVKVNFIFSLLNQMMTLLTPLVITPYVSRVLGVSGIGVYSYTSANVTFFTLIGMMGISGYGQRTIAMVRDDRYKASKIFWELQALHTIMMLIVIVPYCVVIALSTNYRIYYLINIITLFASLLEINWLYQGFENFKIIAIRNALIKLVTICLIFVFVKSKNHVGNYIAIHSVGLLVANFSTWINIRKYVIFIKPEIKDIVKHFKEVVIYFIPAIANSISTVLDKSMINWITHSVIENGYYEQARKVIELIVGFLIALSNAYSPKMSYSFAKNDLVSIKNNMNKAMCFMLFASLPSSLGLVAIARKFVPIFFGEGYDKVIGLLYVFAPMIVIICFSTYLDSMFLVPSGQRGKSAKLICYGAAFNFVTNIILVKYFGAFGATIATLLTELLITIGMIIYSIKILDINSILRMFTKYLLSSIVMFTIIVALEKITPNTLVVLISEISIGVIAYIAIMLIVRDKNIMIIFKTLKNFFFRGAK